MTSGPYFSSDPVCLTLAADAEFGTFEPNIDAVWQLSLDKQGPVTLQTSFGLQAQNFELFPALVVNNLPVSIIQEFFSDPRIDTLLPNYACLVVCPTPDVQARYEVWAEQNDMLLCKLAVKNTSTAQVSVAARFHTRLVPLEGGASMKILKQSFRPFLKGQSGNLEIALASDGNPNLIFSPLPGLEKAEILKPGETLTFTARLAISSLPQSASEKAFLPFPESWDAEIARLIVANQARTVRIETPLQDWDNAIQAVQHTAALLLSTGSGESAIGLLRQRNTHINFAQAVNLPNLASFSLAQPGAVETRQAILTLLPARAAEASKILSGYLQTTLTNLENPALKQRPLPFPCLAELTWRIFQLTADRDFLLRVYPHLKAVTLAWFSPAIDRDQDGWPEWQSLEQTGLKNLRRFDLMDADSLPISITSAENIGLGVLLHAETTALQNIARFLEDEQTMAECAGRSGRLSIQLAQRLAQPELQTWWDRDLDSSPPPRVLFDKKGYLGAFEPIFLDRPCRLHIQLRSSSAFRKPELVILRGENSRGENFEETLTPNAWSWLPGVFYAATQNLFRRVDSLVIEQMDAPDVRIYTGDVSGEDISTCLAEAYQLFADPVDPRLRLRLEDAQSETRYGLPEAPAKGPNDLDSPVNVAWNCLIIQQLLNAGEKGLAWELYARMMEGVVRVLKQEHSLFEGFDSRAGSPVGARNAAGGLLPLEILLEIAGIRIYNPIKIGVSGENPLTWPITVRYRGWEITREGKNSRVVFPDGVTRNHYGSSQKIFLLEPKQGDVNG